MKKSVLFLISICCLAGCNKNDDPISGSKTPEWTYDTGENPYGSKPFIAGNKLIVCSRQEEVDLGTVHCVNLSDGTGIWKMTDSTVIRTRPLVYNDLVIYGGYNVHALKLATGEHQWNYQDTLVKLGLFSSPCISEGSVWVAFTYGLVKLGAAGGAMVWQNSEYVYQNLAQSAAVF
ncbi:MAG: PQQ-binding-like beta-propeller repeat protein [Bacteroidia bacterium]|nr:PQQ-binding-like beta-propeller repeat protein [Bacteroidia bacterium]